MKPKLKLGLVISESRPLSVFNNGRKLETSAGPATASRPSVMEAKNFAGVSHSCCRLSREAEPPPLARLRPANLFAVTVAFWASGRAWPHNLRRLCPTHRSVPKHRQSLDLPKIWPNRPHPFCVQDRSDLVALVLRFLFWPPPPRWRCATTRNTPQAPFRTPARTPGQLRARSASWRGAVRHHHPWSLFPFAGRQARRSCSRSRHRRVAGPWRRQSRDPIAIAVVRRVDPPAPAADDFGLKPKSNPQPGSVEWFEEQQRRTK